MVSHLKLFDLLVQVCGVIVACAQSILSERCHIRSFRQHTDSVCHRADCLTVAALLVGLAAVVNCEGTIMVLSKKFRNVPNVVAVERSTNARK